MKITDITHTPLSIGKGLLRLQTDAGVEGWAEVPGSVRDVPGRRGAVFEAVLEHIIKPALVGEDPRAIDRHWETLAEGIVDAFTEPIASSETGQRRVEALSTHSP